ncbi:MAG: aminopeptidase P family protein [Fimbriimonadales bacterium]
MRRFGLWIWVLTLGSLQAVSEPKALWGIPISEYAERRQALSRTLESDQMVILMAESSPPTRMRFRQENNFMYLTGVETPNAVLVILPEDSPMEEKSVLFLQRRSRMSQIFEGPAPEPNEETRRELAVDAVRDRREFNDFLSEALTHHPKLLTNRPARTALPEILRSLEMEAQIGSVDRSMALMRVVKSPAELALMRRAVAISLEAHRALARRVAPGVYEYELEAAVLEAFRRNGAEREAYPCIIGSGPNACILHYNANKRKLQAGELVLVDVGAEYSYYAADITRTYPVSGKFTPRQRELYNAVLEAMKVAEREAKPGVTLRQLHNKVVEFFRNHSLRAKDENGEERNLDHFFVHGLSHMVGMDVHDPDPNQPLRPGMVFTIEPGLYIPSENIGIRIEDDYLVTETGVVNLSASLPKTAEAIERLVQEGRRSSTPATPARPRQPARSR